MNQSAQPKRPIGYWLKQADKLLTEQINQAQAANGVSRFEWQVLNLLKETGQANREQLFETLRTFVDAAGFDDLLTRLVERGWVESHPGPESEPAAFQLTEAGQRQHEIVFATQKKVRERAMQGISQEEYATVLRVLQQIVNNLGGNSQGEG